MLDVFVISMPASRHPEARAVKLHANRSKK